MIDISPPPQARDPDAEDFGLIWYRLSDPSTPLVVLEEQTGVLKLTQTLGELQSRVAPVFTAAAYDNRGQDPSMTSTNVAVRVCVCVCGIESARHLIFYANLKIVLHSQR